MVTSLVNQQDESSRSIRPLNRNGGYIKYLPAIYSENEFMSRFLMIFESVLGPMERTLDNIWHYLDPHVTPEEYLGWLATWVKIDLMQPMDPLRQRLFLKKSGELFRCRGTKKGLLEYLTLCTGVTPEIEEDFGPILLSADSVLGTNTVLSRGLNYHFTVRFEQADESSINLEQVETIIELEKPAHTTFSVEFH